MSARQSKASKARSALQAQHRDLAVRTGQAPDYRYKQMRATLTALYAQRDSLDATVADLLALHSRSTKEQARLKGQVASITESRDLNRTTLWLFLAGTAAYHGLRYFGVI